MGADDALNEVNKRLSKLGQTMTVTAIVTVLLIVVAFLTLPRGMMTMTYESIKTLGVVLIILGVVCLLGAVWLARLTYLLYRRRKELGEMTDEVIAHISSGEDDQATSAIQAVLESDAHPVLLRRDRPRSFLNVEENRLDEKDVS